MFSCKYRRGKFLLASLRGAQTLLRLAFGSSSRMAGSGGRAVRGWRRCCGSASALAVPVDVLSQGFSAPSAAVSEEKVKAERAQPPPPPPGLFFFSLSLSVFLFFFCTTFELIFCFPAAATLRSRRAQIATAAAATIMYCEDGSLRPRQLRSPWQHFLLCGPCSCVSLLCAACKPGLQEHRLMPNSLHHPPNRSKKTHRQNNFDILTF